MPIFEYRCSACGHLEELLQKHSDPAPDTCPKCQAKATMAKELSLSAFHLKGGGWYKDLYSSSGSSAGSSNESSSSGGSSPPPAPASTTTSAATPSTSAPATAAPAAAAPATPSKPASAA